ncbi:hypothetical protein [Candidatus Hodgkinia cicadicola]|uniref:hypothetical protein n=1 Tax=Candidatus Hodgkinia cicadicola TaxID=573658 RepID=UPI001788A3B4
MRLVCCVSVTSVFRCVGNHVWLSMTRVGLTEPKVNLTTLDTTLCRTKHAVP